MTARNLPFRPRVVGVVHLSALPGSARGGPATDLPALLDRVRADALAFAAGGVDALIVENFGDVPFVKEAAAPWTIAAMTLAVAAVREAGDLPVGVNVLRNDVLGAVSVAAMAGGSFVRANVYAGAALTDQGIIEGRAEAVQALIRRLAAPVAVWADVDVKHAAQLAPRPLGDLAEDAVERGLAAAVIVSGRATGQAVSLSDLQAVAAAVPETPLYVGSGVNAESIGQLLTIASGAIVGTAAKYDGVLANRVDPDRVRAIVHAATI
ncbi:MAG: BtpA/SgcQ family protein [Chloroflexia bacterium]|nr:BtpA/SgcQ family protein [Chloroflexia bacterium]